MQYRSGLEHAKHRHAITEIVDRWVAGEFDVPGDPQAAIETKRRLVQEEVDFFLGRQKRFPAPSDEEVVELWWQRESA